MPLWPNTLFWIYWIRGCAYLQPDDPAYFGGYMGANYQALLIIYRPPKSSYGNWHSIRWEASWLGDKQKRMLEQRILAYV